MNQQNLYRGRGSCGYNTPVPVDEIQGPENCPCPREPIPYMPENAVLAMAYVPMQEFDAMYPPMEALTRGTAFPCLDLPFMGKTIGGCRRV